MDISIIIPNYQKGQLLKNTLHAVTEQTKQDQVIVVDSGGHDKQIAKNFPIDYVEVEHKTYQLASDINAGARKAHNPYLIKIDADCVPQNQWLENMRSYIDEPNCLTLGRVEWIQKNGSIRKDTRFDYNEQKYTHDKNKAPQQAWGGNLAITKQAFWSVDGFTTIYDGAWGSEEADFGWKCFYSGMKLKFNFDSLVKHQYHEDGEYKDSTGMEKNYKKLKTQKKKYQRKSNTTGSIIRGG